MSLTTYAMIDLRRNLRIVSSIFFIVVLPAVFFLVFGALMDWSSVEIGRGNLSAQTMVSMAAYGAITAAAALSGSAAVEQQQGWGRQLALTPMSRLSFVAAKVFVALVVAALPVIVVFVLGAVTTARADWQVWVLSPLLILVSSVVFALYGVAIGTTFRSESAVGAASGVLVILAFLGNAFVPLSGVLLDIGRFTPVYGVMALARYPLTDGGVMAMDGSLVQDPLWLPIANVAAWTIVFGGLAVAAARRNTARG